VAARAFFVRARSKRTVLNRRNAYRVTCNDGVAPEDALTLDEAHLELRWALDAHDSADDTHVDNPLELSVVLKKPTDLNDRVQSGTSPGRDVSVLAKLLLTHVMSARVFQSMHSTATLNSRPNDRLYMQTST
jgi:hypothetical protein